MFLFGVLTIMMEAKNMLCKERWMKIIQKEAKFLTLLAGRGYFYVVLGTILMAQWPDVGDFLIGLYVSTGSRSHTHDSPRARRVDTAAGEPNAFAPARPPSLWALPPPSSTKHNTIIGAAAPTHTSSSPSYPIPSILSPLSYPL